MNASVIRASIFFFDADKEELVERRLIECKAVLESGIRALRGNLSFTFGIDRANLSVGNVSVWKTLEDAQQLDTFQPMLDLAKNFVATLGVRFQRPILNFQTVWEIV